MTTTHTGPTPSDTPVDVVSAAAEHIAALHALLSPIDVYESLTGDRLGTHLGDLKTLSGLATAAQAKAAAACAKTGKMREDGHASLHNQFRSQGHSNDEAARLAKLANGLDDAPDTAAALSDGSITAETAGAIVDALKDGRLGDDVAAVEKELLDLGRNGPVENVRRHVKEQQQRRDGARLFNDEKRQHKQRRASLHHRTDGMWDLYALLSNTAGEHLQVLLDALTTRDPAGTPETQKRSPVQRTADALADAVEWQLAHRDLPTSRGQARPHVTITVEANTVATDVTDTNGQPAQPDHPIWADLDPGQFQWSNQPLSPQQVRTICCDASLTRIVTNALGQALDIGRSTPTWSGPQRTAITFRDGHCRGPKCDRPIGWTEIHHITWYRNQGRTDLNNGISLCRKCHDLPHHSGWQIKLDPLTADATWTSPYGELIVTHPDNPKIRKRRAS